MSASIFTKLADSPVSHSSNLVMLNANEFLFAGENKYYKSDGGIHKYNIKTSQWTLFIQYPSDFTVSFHSICFDKNTNTIYIYGSKPVFASVNIDTKNGIFIKYIKILI